MSQQESNVKMDFEFEFEFKLDRKNIRGIFGIAEKATIVGVEFHSNTTLSPLDVEKCMYQITHLIASKTRTTNQLREEKSNEWN